MIVLKPINTSQVVKFIPTRVGQITKCVLRDDITNVSTEYDITISTSSFFSYFQKILVIEEGKYYDMDLKTSAGVLVHRDKVFCTNQDVDSYTINNGQYVADSQTIIFHD